MNKNIKYRCYEDIEDTFYKFDSIYTIVSMGEFNNRLTEIDMVDTDGYLYRINLERFLSSMKKGRLFQKFNEGNCYTLKNIEKWIEDNNKKYHLCEDNLYNGAGETLFFFCEVCEEIFDSNWGNIHMNRGCPFCSGHRAGSKNNITVTHSQYMLKWNYEKNSELGLFPENFTHGSKQSVWWTCENGCETYEKKILDELLQKYGCRICCDKLGNKKKRENIKKSIKTIAYTHSYLIEEWDEDNEYSPYDLTYGSEQPVNWICKDCENKWTATPNSRTNTGSGCSKCDMSGGAKIVYDFLYENTNFNIKREFTFDNLISDSNHKLRYDFCLIYNNKIYGLVEFDGDQHEKFTPHIHKTHEKFERMFLHNEMKNDYAYENHIPLLRIKHKNLKNYKNIINDFLKNINN